MPGPTRDFWQGRFEAGTTPWDRGEVSPQLLAWARAGALPPAGARVAVPGCGSGWEVAEFAARGLQVTGLDYAEAPVHRTQRRLAERGLQAEVLQVDVLEWQVPAALDAVYEQTCLCALHPDDWASYAGRLAAWLRPGGRLFALFMQVPRPAAASGVIEGPPYHCDINAMRALFPESRWAWPKPPYERVPHPAGWAELAVVLVRR
jgi:methyl halide transferase